MPTLSTEVEPATGEVAVQRVKKENRQAEATATTTYMAEDVDWGEDDDNSRDDDGRQGRGQSSESSEEDSAEPGTAPRLGAM